MDMIYIAHPVRPRHGSTDTIASNLESAKWWFSVLQRANPRVAFSMDWHLEIVFGVGDDTLPEDRALGISRAIARASRCSGIAICGSHIGSGSLAETRAVGEWPSGITPTIHRFMNRDQDLVLPPVHRRRWCDFSDATPWWLRRCQFGAVPQSVELVGAEILAAIEREKVKS